MTLPSGATTLSASLVILDQDPISAEGYVQSGLSYAIDLVKDLFGPDAPFFGTSSAAVQAILTGAGRLAILGDPAGARALIRDFLIDRASTVLEAATLNVLSEALPAQATGFLGPEGVLNLARAGTLVLAGRSDEAIQVLNGTLREAANAQLDAIAERAGVALDKACPTSSLSPCKALWTAP